MNNNERGRITGLPGTETVVTLYPDRLGTRMRNMVIRMLEQHIIVGGWASQSRQLVEALAATYELQISTVNNWNGIEIYGLNADSAPLIADVVRADYAAFALERGHVSYFHDSYESTMVNINNLNSGFYIRLHDKEATRKVTEILAAHTSQKLRDKARKVADLIRGSDPINVIKF